MKLLKFSKKERIYKFSDFQELTSKGNVLFCYPFRCIYLSYPSDCFQLKFAVSVSKKNFKLAVDRNRIKRLIREAYRLQKNEIFAPLENQKNEILFLIIYIEKKEIPFIIIRKQLNILLNRLVKINQKNHNKNIYDIDN